MEYRCISADCHIDLCWLPHDLFVSNATPAMKDRVPFVVDGPDGPVWTTKSGLDMGFTNGKGSAGALGSHGKYIPGKQPRVDRMAATGLYKDGSEGMFRPTTPSLRLKEQDRDGLQAEVLYGLLGAGNKMTERDLAVEFFRIYNDWLFDFCSHDPRRFIGLASIPSRGVEEAVAETHRVAKLGLRGIEISFAWDMTPLWYPYWDPLWKAAAEVNLPVHFHTINPRPAVEVKDTIPKELKVVSEATRLAGFQMYMSSILAAMINGGALERFPGLRVVLGESGIGWIPYVLDRMDSEYEDRFKRDLPLKMKPSEYWRRQCRATFQNDRIGAKLLDDMGMENVMWGSDYPHADGVYPDSQEYIQRQFGHLPSAAQRKITCENAGKFYGLIPA
jgi:uncharacterized protein